VEREFDGLLTYDRMLPKVNFDRVARLNRDLIGASRSDAGRAPPGPALPPGTLAHWTFNEGRGKVARDDTGKLKLKLARGAKWTPGVRGGMALLLNGKKAIAIGKNLVDTSQSFTVSAWVRPDDTAQNAAAVAQGGKPSPGFVLGHQSRDTRPDLGSLYLLYGITKPQQPPNRWIFNLPSLSASSGYGDVGPRPAAGQWQFVTTVFDRYNRVMSLFVDGTLIENRIADRAWRSMGPFLVGGSTQRKGARTFHGAVDDLRVFNRALSAGDVAAYYRAAPQ
jgi:hypothetical protein